MKRRRVKITGIGPVTPAGIGREEFWKGILEPISRIRPYKKIDSEFGPFVAGYIDRFDVGRYIDRSTIPNGAARHTLFALAASILALNDANLGLPTVRKAKCGVFVGASVMDFDGINRGEMSVVNRGLRGVQPRLIFSTHVASIASTLVNVLNIPARAMVFQSSCCGGIDAIGFGAEAVAAGEVDFAICGGTESPLFRHPLLELRAAGLTPSTAELPGEICRPFDLWRTTGVVSEGACMLVLEPESSPRAGISWVRGFAYDHDPEGMLCGGLASALRNVLANALLAPSQVEAINAWGPGHPKIDAAEVRALRSIFGDGIDRIPAVSIKGSLGNPLAAAPAIQVACAALSLEHGIVPPTVNWRYPDPDCALSLSSVARSMPHRISLVDAHGLSGMNSCMILEQCN